LTRDSGYSGGSWGTHNFYHSDGNGNVDYIATTALAIAASYKYFPYGGLISSSDGIGNVYRFSSKEEHLSSGLYYYGYRFYAPGVQRCLSRDPVMERGGFNLYEFEENDPAGRIDPLGLWTRHDITQFIQTLTPLGGRCKNSSAGTEWALVDGKWRKLSPGESTGVFEDCDGMTCGGGFYAVYQRNGECKTPGHDKCPYNNRRWTPDQQDPGAEPPVWDPRLGRGRGSVGGNTPPGYKYHPRPVELF
jgi:RHS repeat-associated protein